MTRALRQRVTVDESGRIEIRSAELQPGQSAEVIVLVEDAPSLQSNESFFGSGKGAYTSPSEADKFLRRERDAWPG